MQVVEICDLHDELLLPWLDLYETAFPPDERVLVSFILKVLKDKALGQAQQYHLLAALDAKTLIGMAMYELFLSSCVALLWCLAIAPDERSRGWGGQLYEKILEQLNRTNAAMLIEVEIPEEMHSDQERQLAQRRIEFYRRQGARVLRGVRYMQYVGQHQPPIPMHVMVHPFQPMNPQTAFNLAQAVFGDWITRAGMLALE
jgi:ribosomal protein S18 acetylase RimI-like enzyme